MTPSSLLSGRRSVSVLAVAASIAAFGALGLQTAAASKDAPAVPAPPTQPTRADQIQNIDQVKTAIKAYYGDKPSSATNPVDGTTNLRTFSDTGAYAQEMGGLTDEAWSYLADPKHASGVAKEQGKPAPATPGRKAILLRRRRHVAEHVQLRDLQQLRLQPDQQRGVRERGCVPGGARTWRTWPTRPKAARLHRVLPDRPPRGASAPAPRPTWRTSASRSTTSQVDLKDDAGQSWITCDTDFTHAYDTCTTTGTPSVLHRRAQVPDPCAHRVLGYDIVANFGDQFSDLYGGYADRTFKVPNPMYYLP